MNDVEALLKASRAIGADESLVLWGGGNSSVKSETLDFRGRRRRVLYVKGSGSDMRTLERKHLALLDLEALLELQRRDSLTDETMVAYLAQAMLEPGPRGSIETLLHAFIPVKFVLHTHADATAALVDNPRSKKHVSACWKGSVALVPYQRPGFSLSQAAARAYENWHSARPRRGGPLARPELRGIMLDKHGLVTWGETAEEALRATKRLIAEAQTYVSRRRKSAVSFAGRASGPPLHGLLPILRGALSVGERQILMADTSPAARAFSLRKDAGKLCAAGPATPDHLLYTKPRASYIPDVSRIGHYIAHYRRWYDSYFRRYAGPGLIKLDSAPRVIVIKGYGMVTAGKDTRTALFIRDIFRHSMKVRQGAVGLGGYQPIGTALICDFEYWPLENYKLTLAPPEKELSRKIALVTGAARGIGKACALKLAREGACVALLDLDFKAAAAAAAEIGPQAMAIRCDVSSEIQVKKAFEQVVLRWGGLDIFISNAGLAKVSPVDSMKLSDWESSFAVNARGHFLCSREAARIFKAQGIGGSIVVVSSKNVLSPGKDFGAYSASKAAQTQLAKVMAIELAEIGVRVNSVTPDGVFEDSRLWDSIREGRSRAHGIKPSELEEFYMKRNLLKRRVRPSDVADAVFFLASERSSRTTGTLLPVDAGLKDAFPR